MLAVVLVLIVAGTSIWVGVDAAGLRARGADIFPVQWGLGTLLVWIIVFPVYLGKRGGYVRETGCGGTSDPEAQCRKAAG